MASVYRTGSESAVMVIPIAHLAKESKAIYKRKEEDSREIVAREEQ